MCEQNVHLAVRLALSKASYMPALPARKRAKKAAARTDATIADPMTSSFSNLMLAEPLARAVAEMGDPAGTPIQGKAIPVVLTGQDVMGAAQTGTGKTAAFSLPLLQRLLRHESSSASPARHPVRALVLLPTREL